jgi:hypothetical protein
MRIWDIAPELLCDRHLIAEHGELHAIWSVIVEEKTGYSRHPETVRWKGRLRALYNRHQELVGEMGARGFKHGSPLDESLATGAASQDTYLLSPGEQLEILSLKSCCCPKGIDT